MVLCRVFRNFQRSGLGVALMRPKKVSFILPIAICLAIAPAKAVEGDVYVTGGSLDGIGGTVDTRITDAGDVGATITAQLDAQRWLVASVSFSGGAILGAILGKGAFTGA